ncbi:unnamed protein product [Urochloa humidicola]
MPHSGSHRSSLLERHHECMATSPNCCMRLTSDNSVRIIPTSGSFLPEQGSSSPSPCSLSTRAHCPYQPKSFSILYLFIIIIWVFFQIKRIIIWVRRVIQQAQVKNDSTASSAQPTTVQDISFVNFAL